MDIDLESDIWLSCLCVGARNFSWVRLYLQWWWQAHVQWSPIAVSSKQAAARLQLADHDVLKQQLGGSSNLYGLEKLPPTGFDISMLECDPIMKTMMVFDDSPIQGSEDSKEFLTRTWPRVWDSEKVWQKLWKTATHLQVTGYQFLIKSLRCLLDRPRHFKGI
jgi:hypothetical protein